MSSLMVLISVPTISPVVLEPAMPRPAAVFVPVTSATFNAEVLWPERSTMASLSPRTSALTWIPAVLLMASRTS